MDIIYYHNPRCSTSRKGLELLRAHGVEPKIIEYLKNPPTRAELQNIIAKSGLPIRDFLRRKETIYQELQLDNADDTALLDALTAHPVLLERPLAATTHSARVGRPPERLLELLE